MPIRMTLPLLVLCVAGASLASAAPTRASGSRVGAVSAQGEPASREQVKVADRLAQTFAQTWNLRDGVGYGDAYWPDAELVDPSGQVWSGRAAIIATHVALWHGPARATHMTAQVRRVRMLSGSLFVVDIDTSASGFSPPPPGAQDGIVQTRLKHVVQKRGSEWKIVASQNTFVSQR